MAQTTAGSLKSLIEGLGLSLTAYRKQAPAGIGRPYVTIHDRIAFVPDGSEDGGPGTVRETCQIDLWQDWKNLATGAVAESYTLLPALERGLHGARTPQVGGRTVYRVYVSGSANVDEPEEENLIHAALTVEVLREF